jgi:DNA polymerase III subunit delta
MYYIFHGEDDLGRAQELKKLRGKMGDPQFADLNTTTLDGRTASLGEIRHHADAIPFLSDKRLVIVEGLLARFNPQKRKKETDAGQSMEDESDPEFAASLSEYLSKLPETTRLIFVEPKTLPKTNPILRLALKDRVNAHVKFFGRPHADELADWIVANVEAKGGRIEFAAANDLAIFIGADLRALDNEVEKLMAYRPGEAIRRDDVRALVAPAQEQSIFEMTDAMGKRDVKTALELLHDQLSHSAEPLYLLAMIARQFRLLLQVRDLATRGLSGEAIRARLGLHPYVARKIFDQARNFSMDQLEASYRKLLDVDIAMKTGHGEPGVNLDVLVVELAALGPN